MKIILKRRQCISRFIVRAAGVCEADHSVLEDVLVEVLKEHLNTVFEEKREAGLVWFQKEADSMNLSVVRDVVDNSLHV